MDFLVGSEKKFIDFISNIDEKDKIALICHNDIDGLASAAIISKVVGKLDFLKFIGYSYDMLDKIIPELKKRKINKIVFADIAIDNETKSWKELEKFECLIIDHHLFKEDLNSNNLVYLKADTKEPACYMCYYLFSKFQTIPSWIAALGIVSDRPQIYGEKNADEVFRDYGFEKQKDIWKYVKMLNNSLIYFRDKEEKVFEVLTRAKKLEDLHELEKYSEDVEKELEEKLREFEEKAERHGRLSIYQFKSRFPLSSIVSTILSLREPNKTFIMLTKIRETIKLSARRQDGKVSCPELLKKAIEGIEEASVGGHVAAAGGNFPAKHLKKFKEQLVEAYNLLEQ